MQTTHEILKGMAPVDVAAPAQKRPLGMWMATALVVGYMIGSGVFLLPASLAGATGPIAIVSWLLAGAGALFLALVFANLSRAFPRTGGPYVYAHLAFGDFIGFQTVWGYWISLWVGMDVWRCDGKRHGKPARTRKSIHYDAIYRHHPLFAGHEFEFWSDGLPEPLQIEGGDALVIGNGALLGGAASGPAPLRLRCSPTACLPPAPSAT